jgi:putative transposase
MLEDKIAEVWKKKGREVYGARKVWLELNAQGVTVARCTVERLCDTKSHMCE